MTKQKKTTGSNANVAKDAMEGEHMGPEITSIGAQVLEPWSMHTEVMQMMQSTSDGKDTEKAKRAFEAMEKLARGQRKVHRDTLNSFNALDESMNQFYRKSFKAANTESERDKVRADYNEQLNKSRDAKTEAHKETTGLFKTTVKWVGLAVAGTAAVGLAVIASANSRK